MRRRIRGYIDGLKKMMMKENKLYQQQIDRISAALAVKEGKFLITGATGLIGSCLTDVLARCNTHHGGKMEIYVMGRSEERLRARFGVDCEKEGIRFLVQDVTESFKADLALDYIIHAASNADPVAYATHPVGTVLTNVLGTKQILDYCVLHTGCRMLFLSTFEVYGVIAGQDSYQEEQSGVIDLTMLRNCYPESKRTAEFLVRAYAKEFGVQCVIGRLSSIYGSTMQKSDSKAHAQFLRSALAHENIVLKSTGEQRRTYCYVMDAVDALLYVLFHGESSDIYNIANSKSVASIAEVAGIISRISGVEVVFDLPSEIERIGFSKPSSCILNTEKLEQLGWNGSYSLETGFSDTLAILRETQQE